VSDEDLLSAYADGIAELDPDERRRADELLARDPAARAELDATRALLGKLRELSNGDAPDLAAQIARAVGPDVPRPWWRNWRWLVPIGALAATAALALVWIAREPAHQAPVATTPHDAGATKLVEPAIESPAADAIWLAGQIVELSNPTEIDAQLDALESELANEPEDVSNGILPASDLRWIDNLDDAAIDRAERFLEKKKT
jgi:anti-sigma factor RsiW